MITSVWKLALPSYTIYSNSLPVPSLIFYGPPPRASRGSAIHVFLIELVCRLVNCSLLTLIHPSATDLWKRIPERIASSVNNSPSLVLLETDLQRKINQKILAHPKALKARAFLIRTPKGSLMHGCLTTNT